MILGEGLRRLLDHIESYTKLPATLGQTIGRIKAYFVLGGLHHQYVRT
jgi:hypothetical protein